MSARLFHSFQSRFAFVDVSALLAPRKPRHPLMRVLLGVLGLALLALLLVVGLFVGMAMLVGGLLLRLVRQRGKPVASRRHAVDRHAFDQNVVDGEYRVVDKTGQPLLR